jgi:hypothetical protein
VGGHIAPVTVTGIMIIMVLLPLHTGSDAEFTLSVSLGPGHTHLMSPTQKTPRAGMNTIFEWSHALDWVMPPTLCIKTTHASGIVTVTAQTRPSGTAPSSQHVSSNFKLNLKLKLNH